MHWNYIIIKKKKNKKNQKIFRKVVCLLNNGTVRVEPNFLPNYKEYLAIDSFFVQWLMRLNAINWLFFGTECVFSFRILCGVLCLCMWCEKKWQRTTIKYRKDQHHHFKWNDFKNNCWATILSFSNVAYTLNEKRMSG